VVRYRLAPDQVGPSGETLTDVIGVLEAWAAPNEAAPHETAPNETGPNETGPRDGEPSGGTATVRRASGEQVTVPLALIVAGKVLPPAVMRPRRQHY
jgi:hypothetical protein